jgi:hypothetical protein
MMSDKKLYLVETVSIFRMRYVIEAEDESHALDEVTYHVTGGEELKEFSQKHIDEVVVSSRKISNKSYLKLFDKDNDYLKNWNKEQKLQYVNWIDYEKNSNNG